MALRRFVSASRTDLMYPVSFGFMFVKSFLLGCSGFCADSPIPSPDSEKRAMNEYQVVEITQVVRFFLKQQVGG